MEVSKESTQLNDNDVNDSVDKMPSTEEIYLYYKENLGPAIMTSLPVLASRIADDTKENVYNILQKVYHFLIPWKQYEDYQWPLHITPPNLQIATIQNWIKQHGNFTVAEFMLRHFDTDADGHISTSELLRVNTDIFPTLPPVYQPPQTIFTWFQRAWPLMDWKLGVFLWRSCGGLLLVIAIATIIPGRLHTLSGQILRWPILILTYFMIFVELIVYIIIRIFIRLAETTFANSKHRALRRSMNQAKSYEEWYKIAKELDISQGRDKWQNTVDDDTSYKYNWAFINELMSDLRSARNNDDSLLALTVLQQCTRKNVGGIMSEDLFSYTNTGEPKLIVKNFIEEVTITLRWLTEKVKSIPQSEKTSDDEKEEDRLDQDSEENENPPNLVQQEKEINPKGKEDDNKVRLDLGSLDGLLEHIFGIPCAVLGWVFQGDKHTKHKMKSDESKSETVHLQNNVGNVTDIKITANESSENDTDVVQTTDKLKPSILPEKESELQHQLKLREDVNTLLKRARAAYGRTALCLSGGAMMGNYHFGHVKSLIEVDVLPHIISGTSAGSVVAALLCTRNEDELKRDLCPEILVDRLTCFSETWPNRFRNVYEKGTLFNSEDWLKLIKWFTCGDLTFEEAYKKTGRLLCITLSATTKKAPPALINYITAPNVTIASAIIASAAVPGFIKPVTLQIKDANGNVRNQAENKDQSYWDGSIDQDIPTSGLAEMLNCHFFLAAQCNPHIVPFFYNSKGDVGRPSRWSRGLKNDSWRGGFLLAALELYLKSDMRAKFHFLNDLEAAVGFTSTMMTQEYGGTTTIVPRISVQDYFKLMSNPTLVDLKRYFQVGSIAAYQHCAMMKYHYSIAHAIDECLGTIEEAEGKQRRRWSQVASQQRQQAKEKGFSLISVPS